MTKKILIVANGHFELSFLSEIKNDYDKIISVDGATNKLFEINMNPDIIVGDFDSIRCDVLQYYKNIDAIEFIKLDTKKDFSDTHYAIDIAKQRGYFDISVIGSFGGRWDHSISNLGLIYFFYNQNVNISLIEKFNNIRLCKKGIYNFEKKENYYWSFFPIFEDVEISIRGMKYNLSNKKIKQGDSVGLSNEFIGSCEIEIKEGSTLVVESKFDK